MPELIQMIGRLFRRAEGKTHAEVYQILPAAVPNSKRFKDQRNAILTVVFSAMLLEDVFLPISLSTGPKKSKRDRTDRLISTIPDTETWQALSRDFLVAANGETTTSRGGWPHPSWNVMRLRKRNGSTTGRNSGGSTPSSPGS